MANEMTKSSTKAIEPYDVHAFGFGVLSAPACDYAIATVLQAFRAGPATIQNQSGSHVVDGEEDDEQDHRDEHADHSDDEEEAAAGARVVNLRADSLRPVRDIRRAKHGTAQGRRESESR